ncbi:metalloregulator ArsR/SmtB family transcription factor [Danxiaibacter flavus]|jgi:DNA-binding transcriptional ArsR family regulator|uniref:Metalloregulator ArsR/SmtB family transcription factor n=1 Tax=Danxiaibacter flavus TaxID=3049108 RepID=A0ABV3ZKQ5_9BACT|nr:metalloregulator ArsR/SmtB family transcription factor [Chitinophagaceae bacterium DXS]
MNTPAQTVVINDPASKESIKVDYLHLKKAALILRALNHKLRQQMVKLLDEHKKMTVTEIYVKLRLEQSVASQHLAILRRAGIVTTQRDGKFIYYHINYERVKEVSQFVEDLVS